MEFLWTGLLSITWQQAVMYLVGIALIYLAIEKDYEPSLLLPMGFGAILVNLPESGALNQMMEGVGETHGIIQWLFEVGIEASEALPILLFIGVTFYTSNKGNIRAVYKMLAVEILLIVLCALAQMMFGGGFKEGQTLMEIYETAGESGMGGGLIGGVIVLVLHTAIGDIGAYLVLFLCMIISLVCITEKAFGYEG